MINKKNKTDSFLRSKDQDPQLSVINSQPLEQPLLFVTGPTASGKSDLAMRVAQEFDGEIICADSQTVRRGLDIGTAKPSKEDQARVPHHLLDAIDPFAKFNLAKFMSRAEEAITNVQNRGKLPIIVGGTGLYIDALLYGFSLRPSTSEYSRKQLEQMTVDELQEIIQSRSYTMPKNTQNPRHLIRTIEAGGQVSSKKPLRPGAIVTGIDPGKEELEKRIEKRAHTMLENGLVEEFQKVLEKYGDPDRPIDAIAYKVLQEHPGASTRELQEKLVIADRQYAKKQRSWMKRNSDIQWFETIDDAYAKIKQFLKSAQIQYYQ